MFRLSNILQKSPVFLHKTHETLHKAATASNTSKLTKNTTYYAVKGMSYSALSDVHMGYNNLQKGWEVSGLMFLSFAV